MEVEYKPSFIKDFNKIKNRKDQKDIYAICFEEILEVKRFPEIRNLKKIKGYDHYYRIRKGDYRIGFKYDGKRVVFMRVLKRSDIYKSFP
ncbi:MAG: type II toxin-antitoxin system RelE/ParE family toxin [bacterium]|nr:type II toxin-antitoxin system RelE/ParE family toxin [bacterium]